MALGNGNGKAAEPMTLAAVDAQLATLADAARAQEAIVATAQETLRAARRAREEGEIREVLQMAKPAEVEALRRAEHEQRAALAGAEGKLPALIEAAERLRATRPAAEAIALRERVFDLRRQYAGAVGELQAALAGAAAANATVHQLEQQAAALCPSGSTLLKAARLSTGATNLGFGGHLAWREFISDGSSDFKRWKQRAKAAIAVPADLATLLEPEPGTVTPPTHAEIYAHGFDLLVGGPQPKAPSQNQPAPRRFR